MLSLRILLGAVVLSSPLTAAESEISGSFSLIVGQARPERADATRRLISTGVVIPLADQGTGARVKLELPLDVPAKLTHTLQLEYARIDNARLVEVSRGELVTLRAADMAGVVSARVRLAETSSTVATFEVEFHSGDRVLATSRVVVEFGRRAVVGALNEETGNYFFLVASPLSAGPVPAAGNRAKPMLVDVTMPRYTKVMTRGRLEGQVKVRGVVELDGSPSSLKVVEAPDPELGISALEALKKWRYRPGTDDGGEQVRVEQTWVVRFVIE